MSGLLLAAPLSSAAAGVQSSTGFGFALLLGPAMFAVLPAEEAVAALLVLGLELNLLVLFAERRRPAASREHLTPVLLASLPGLFAGALIVRSLPKATLQAALGATILIAAGIQLAAIRDKRRATVTAAVPVSWAIGAATGLLTTATSVSGPPLVLWLHARGLRGAQLRDSLSAAFLFLNLAGAAVVVMVAGVHEGAGHVDWLLVLVPLVALGHLAGRLAFERLGVRRHELLVLACVALAGCASLVAGLTAR
jgi:uncharacterized membrane protein YfcA